MKVENFAPDSDTIKITTGEGPNMISVIINRDEGGEVFVNILKDNTILLSSHVLGKTDD